MVRFSVQLACKGQEFKFRTCMCCLSIGSVLAKLVHQHSEHCSFCVHVIVACLVCIATPLVFLDLSVVPVHSVVLIFNGFMFFKLLWLYDKSVLFFGLDSGKIVYFVYVCVLCSLFQQTGWCLRTTGSSMRKSSNWLTLISTVWLEEVKLRTSL